MTHAARPEPSYPSPNGTGEPPVRKRKRLFMWFFLAVQALFLIWIIAGASSSTTAKSCANLTGQALKTCQDASHVGTGIGVFLIIIFWVIVDILLTLVWAVVRLSSRRR